MKKEPMLSVIIPIYNDEKYIGKCLDSIFDSDYPDFEVIIVNDASTDRSSDIIKRFLCRVIDLEKNRGVAYARNEGARAAKGDVLVFFDSDVVVEKDTLSKFARAYEDPNVKICQCRITPHSLTPGFASEFVAIMLDYRAGLMVPYTTYLLTMAFSIKRSVFFEIGGFNTNFKLSGGEEFEIGTVIQRHNYKMFLDMSFGVYHHYPHFLRRFKKLIRRSYVYGLVVLRRNFKLDKGYGTLRDGINAMLSMLGIFSLCISPFIPYLALLFFATLATHTVLDFGIYAHVARRKGLLFFLRSIPVNYLWYLSMGMGVTAAILTYYLQKISPYLKIFNFLFSGTPPYIIFFVTDRCNARCKHCFNWRRIQNPQLSKELSLDEVEKISVHFERIKYMTYTGGEPSLREDIAEVTQVFYKNNGLEILNFTSNGFATELLVDKIGRILRTCPDLSLMICFSIDAIGKQHDEIRNVPGGFKRLLRSIDEIKKLQRHYSNLKIYALTTYSKFNKNEVFDIIDYITKKLKLEMALGYVRGDTFDKDAKKVDLDTYRKATEIIMRMNRINSENFGTYSLTRAVNNISFRLIARTKKEKRSVIPCVAGKKLIEIGSDGKIFPCEMLDIDFGNIRDYNYDIKKVLESKEALDFSKFLKEGDCFCTWECAMKNNIVHSVTNYPSLLFEWVKQLSVKKI
jgi:glycosyltransferase involved in cell wall biosynthesis/MoaA/NifB/PqqE/SkfB family radical SAM enzyme